MTPEEKRQHADLLMQEAQDLYEQADAEENLITKQEEHEPSMYEEADHDDWDF